MIGLGAKYLTAAGFGRYRITAASLGNLDLLGTFRWLKGATQQAILGAFGDDGWAVIKATNEYLNGIAASDRDKATALAGYLNEDPMMVCSLGLEPQGVTMPIRYATGNGSGNYFQLGIVPTEDMSMKLKVCCTTNTTNRLFYVRNNYSDGSEYGFWVASNNVISAAWGRGAATKTIVFNSDGYVTLEVNKTEAKMNGEAFALPQGTLKTTTYPFVLPALNQTAGIYQEGHTNKIMSLEISKTGADYFFLPIKRNGVMELLDVWSGNLATRTGTFTEEFTRGKQPWTPSTP